MPAIEDLTAEWLNRVKKSRQTHLDAMDRKLSLHFKVGTATAALAALVGVILFAVPGHQVSAWIRIPLLVTSAVAALLAALQTAVKFPEQAEKHRLAAAEFDAIERNIEVAMAQSDKGHPIAARQLEEFRIAMDRASRQAPEELFERLLKTVRKPLKRRKAAPRPGTLSIFRKTSQGPS